jgi:adenine-specific DNA-methyltransferase
LGAAFPAGGGQGMSLRRIRARLGVPYFEAEGILLYHSDCLTGLQQLEPDLLDLTVTSPPYNIGKEYESPMPLADYLGWCELWMREIHRLTKYDGAFWLNLGYLEIPEKAKAIPIPYLLWDRSPFYLIQEVVWNYGAGVSTKRMFAPRNEKFLWYVRSPEDYQFNLDAVRDPNVKYPNQKKNGKLKCNPLGKNPTDVWEIAKVTSGENRASKERTPHPAQFPLALIDRIIKACSDDGDVICDPFMGSGTTAVAALQNGRQVVGFEIREDYCGLAKSRISRFLANREVEAMQARLFA